MLAAALATGRECWGPRAELGWFLGQSSELYWAGTCTGPGELYWAGTCARPAR